MEHDKIFIALGVVLAVLLVLTLLVWAIWTRPFLKHCGVRTTWPYSLIAPVVDFAAGLNHSHGRLHWSLGTLGLLLALLASDFILLILLLLFET